MSKKQVSIGIVGLISALIILWAELSGSLLPGDRLFADYMFKNHPAEIEHENVAMVAIDEASLAHFAQQNSYWPWPREFYAILVDYLAEQGADVIVLDILYDTPDFDRTAINGEVSDRRFMESMKQAGNTVLGFKSSILHPDMSALPVPDEIPEPLAVENCGEFAPHLATTLPISNFLNSTELIGNTHIETGSDGLIRNQNLLSNIKDYGFAPSLSLATYLMTMDDHPTIACGDKSLQIGDKEIPLQADNSYLINWYGQGDTGGTFPYYSFQRVVRDAIGTQFRDNFEPEIDPSVFEDKVIFVGANAAGLADIKNTPVSALADFPGMEIHATVFQNLIDESFIERLSAVLAGGIILLLTLTLAFVYGFITIRKSTFLTIGLIIFIPLIAGLFFYQYQLWLPITSLFFTTGLTFSAITGLNYFTEGREKRQIRSAFNQYVQPEVVQELMDKPEMLKLGGDKKNLTVLFSDLAGFTSISESMHPEELISILNIYLDDMSEVILQNGGTIDKYIGDAIMAFWGAPLPMKQSADVACSSALKMSALTPHIKKKIGRDDIELITRFGINTGDVVVGNIGSENRFSYTVLGDAVNLAARLEPANKVFGTDIMISEFTKEKLSDHFLCRQLDLMIVKGKSKPVKVYELMADLSDNDDHTHKQKAVEVYNEGLKYYFDRRWPDAITQFEMVEKWIENDGPAKEYIARCEKFIEQPPEDDWKGVFQMTTK